METSAEKIWDVVVIGGGPAGIMAAARAGERGQSVVLLEKNARLGKKLSITGGGRCNVTNNKPAVRTILSAYKDSGKFLFSTFTQHGVTETIDWFQKRGVPFHEENDGRLFPVTNSAETICEALVTELAKQHVPVRLKTTVANIAHGVTNKLFTITLTSGETIRSRACIVATGGTSRPDTGSTGEGFRWLAALGHTVTEDSLALVPLTLHNTWVQKVSGIVLTDIKISLYAGKTKQASRLGKILFTHTGISGPTILNLSSTVRELLRNDSVTLTIDLFPTFDAGALRTYISTQLTEHSNRKLRNVLAALLPKALVTVILEELAIDPETPSHSVRSEDRVRLVAYLKKLPLSVKGLLGPDKAIVSSGGVVLPEIDFKTMESRLVPGLFLVGDTLNIDRPSGGYSLQLCWSTGFVAGDHA